MRIGGALLWMCAVGVTACAAPSGSGTPAAATLVGTRWMGVMDPSVDSRHVPWLEFVAEGRLSGFTGCNLLHGAWKNEGGELRVGPIVTTKRACVGPEGDIERRVLAGFNPQSSVTRKGDHLVFTSAGGERLEFVEAK